MSKRSGARTRLGTDVPDPFLEAARRPTLDSWRPKRPIEPEVIVPAPLPKLTEDDLIHGYRHDMTFTMGATRQAKLPEVCPKCGLRPPGDLNRTSGERLVRHFKSKHADDRGRATLKLNAETRFEFTFLTPDTGTDGRRILVVGDLTPWMVTTLILDEYTIEWWRDGANVPVNE